MDEGPAGYVVTVDGGDRIHFLDWGGPTEAANDISARPGALLIHGLSGTVWNWAPVARRIATRLRTTAMDLRGHGLSDAPTDDEAYALSVQADDAIAAAEGSGVLDPAAGVVLAGHGFGGIVAAWAAARLGDRCVGLVLVDGGWERLADALDMDADEFLRGIDEPPEVMRSMRAFLADRRAFDPGTWDHDQEVAARATVVETHAGRVVPATRPHALEGAVRAMFEHDPLTILPKIHAPITALIAADPTGDRRVALAHVSSELSAVGRASIEVIDLATLGHNLMRYRPDDVADAILRSAAVR